MGEPSVGAGPEAGEHALERALQIAERAWPGVDGGERVDEHDLPVEPGEVVAEERLHHVRLVALEAAGEHGAETAAAEGSLGPGRQRKEGEERGAGKVAWQQEAAGPGRRQ